MGKIAVEKAFLFSERKSLSDVLRQALKAGGLQIENIVSIDQEKDFSTVIHSEQFSYLILDWEKGADTICHLLEENRKEHALESHPVLLLASEPDEKIIQTAAEYFVSHLCIGEVTVDSVSTQVKAMIAETRNLSPIRQVLVNVENLKRSKKIAEAIELLVSTDKKIPGNPRVIVELAELHVEEKRWEEAEKLLEKHLEDNPPLARVKHLYAKCMLNKKNYEKAVASLKGAQVISPYNTERLLEIADVYLDLDRLNDADATYSDILKIAPGSKNAKMGKSKVKLLAGEINEALAIIKECGNNRDLSSVFNTSAVVAINQKKFSQGFDLYQRALKLLASDNYHLARIIYNMGIGLFKNDKKDKALLCFEKAFELDPKFVNAEHNVRALKNASNEKSLNVLSETEFEPIGDIEIGGVASTEAVEGESDQDDIVDGLDFDSIFDDVENF